MLPAAQFPNVPAGRPGRPLYGADSCKSKRLMEKGFCNSLSLPPIIVCYTLPRLSPIHILHVKAMPGR